MLISELIVLSSLLYKSPMFEIGPANMQDNFCSFLYNSEMWSLSKPEVNEQEFEDDHEW
jgi:hypothetical protein